MSRNVLVVEDDKDIAHLLDLHLRDEGYSVTVVSDGKTGLEPALSKPYDIGILDLLLPGMAGLERVALVIDPEKRKVTVRGNPVHLTAREFELLQEFARHPGRVYTRAQLLDKVWGYSYQGYEHTVNSHINRLREKIEKDPAKPRYILTVRGVGYRFAEPGDREKG